MDVAVPQLIEKPANMVGDRNLMEGDVVLFRKQEGSLPGHYHYGMVVGVEESEDRVVRKVEVKYRNFEESSNRITRRSVSRLVLIRRVDEVDIWKEMFDAASIADIKLLLSK